MRTTPGGVPVSAVDPFGDDFLADPFRWHGDLRDAGPVVWLERYGIWAMARYAEVHEALRDWATFCSSAGVGLSDFRRETPWRPPSLLLEADPPEHSRARTAVARALTPRTVRDLRAGFSRAAIRLAGEVAGRGTVDGVADIAEAFPLRVFAEAVGLAGPGGEQLLAYGNMAFNAFGPRNELTMASLRQATEVGAWIAAQCTRDALTPGGLGARIYASVDDGTISADEAALLVRSLLTADVDTTVIGLGCALDCLARDPSQWQLLREDATRAGAAFEESRGTPRPCRPSSAPPPARSRWMGSGSARGRRSCCSSPRRTGIRGAGTIPTASTCAAAPTATSRSASASMPASARPWPGLRARCCWRRWPAGSAGWTWPGSHAAG